MLPSWLSDLLLESPAPPPNWLPNRSSRLADARLILRRRFGRGRTSNRPGHHLRDLGSAYPLFSGSRVVSGTEIEADLEADITTVNPPILQGWAVIASVLAVAGEVAGLFRLEKGDLSVALALFIGSAAGWTLAVCAVGAYQRVIVFDATGVHVRRWTDVWFGRRGVLLGDPSALPIGQLGSHRLQLAGELGSMVFGVRLWPRSAHQDLAEEPPIWGVQVDLGGGDRHRRRHPGD